ncbi:splicing factor ESS-2 homolog [Schistocerca gregaria]|uniref:splicing factor ESS-2 homolog n=1 Tax=Schistocerca gregaria TaxID=7010 RepID=UPI00211E7DCB|nr:splicing factor ESS-2 homolog [Schistocerca gregaria]
MREESGQTPKPGERALAVMKFVEDVAIFKRPDTPKIKRKAKKVLDEDSYIQEMGKIIQRDFFPDLEKLKAQNEYLDAVEKNDIEKLRELYSKYSSGKRPPTERYASPATFETPLDVRREDDPAGSATPKQTAKDIHGNDRASEVTESASDGRNSDPETKSLGEEDGGSVKLSLDQYLNSHTSEDNQSFQEIMEAAEVKHRQKYSWLYAKEDNSDKDKNKRLTLPSIEQQAAGTERPLMIDTWGYTNKNYIMYVPDGVALTPEEEVERARRKQEVVHQNTRLAKNPFDEQHSKEVIHQLAQSQAQALEGKIGVDGKELTQTSATPTIRGFSFVKTPSPAPGVNESPLMTWGEIEGTPFRLDGGDTPVRPNTGPSFRMPEPPKREKLALALAERAGERLRDRKTRAIATAYQQLSTPSPRPGSGTLERLSSMSPAARRLATAQLRTSDRALQASYSPSPRRCTGGTSNGNTPTPVTPGTPRSAAPGSTRAAVSAGIRRHPTPGRNLTDNLLCLPKRARASDFF